LFSTEPEGKSAQEAKQQRGKKS